MDGDTSGGLSPIAGIDKAFLRKWLIWMEQEGPDEIGAIPALNSVNQQQPTAELRPLEDNQTDEDDLIGGFRLVNGDTVWVDVPAVVAAVMLVLLLLILLLIC